MLLAILVPVLPPMVITPWLRNKMTILNKLVWIGLATQVLANGLTIIFDKNTSIAAIVVIMSISGISHGLTMASLTNTIQVNANNADDDIAASTIKFLRNMGMCIGVSSSSAVFHNLMAQELEAGKLQSSLAQHAIELIADLGLIPDNYPSKKVILRAYSRGYKGVAVLLTALTGVALLLSLFIRAPSATTSKGKEIDKKGIKLTKVKPQRPLRSPTTPALEEARQQPRRPSSSHSDASEQLFDVPLSDDEQQPPAGAREPAKSDKKPETDGRRIIRDTRWFVTPGKAHWEAI